MEHFVAEGQWWLPEEPHRRVPGALTFNAHGLTLVLYEALHRFDMPTDRVVRGGAPKWEVEQVLHGTTRDGRDFSLFDVAGANMKGPFSDAQEVYWPELALDGYHVRSDDFSEVWCSFDYLDPWADPPSITAEGTDPGTVQLRPAPVDLAETHVRGASLRLVSGVHGDTSGARVHLERRTSFAISPSTPQKATALLNTLVRALQDLLVFSLGRPVRLTTLRLLPTDLPDSREAPAAAFFHAIQPADSARPTLAEIEDYRAPTILTLHSPLAAEQVLARWFDLWGSRRDVFTLLLGPLYAPFMYGEHGFAATFQSAEALHDAVLPTRDVSKADHGKRVDAVIEALEVANLDASIIEWASRVLGSRNDKPLARKIEDLVRSTGHVGEAVLAADPEFGSMTASARAGVSHGAARRKLDAAQQYWYGQVLRWVVRTRLLMDLLDNAQEAQRRVLRRAPFRRSLREIGDYTTAREALGDAGSPTTAHRS